MREWLLGLVVPALSFARDEGETFTVYVERKLDESRRLCRPCVEGERQDGRYCIDYDNADNAPPE